MSEPTDNAGQRGARAASAERTASIVSVRIESATKKRVRLVEDGRPERELFEAWARECGCILQWDGTGHWALWTHAAWAAWQARAALASPLLP